MINKIIDTFVEILEVVEQTHTHTHTLKTQRTCVEVTFTVIDLEITQHSNDSCLQCQHQL